MMIFLHEITHLVLSGLAGWLLFRYFKAKILFFYAFLAGVLIDLDHFVDYFLYTKSFVFNLQEFLSGTFFRDAGKVYVFFHGYEYAIILFITAFIVIRAKGKSIFAGILMTMALSMSLHLLLDQFSYRPKPLAYSIAYRVLNNFDHDKIGLK